MGLRNVVAHPYFAVDPEVVWVVAKEQAPMLKGILQRILEEEGEERCLSPGFW